MKIMTNFEIGKCIKLGRKHLDIRPQDIIKRILTERKTKKIKRLELITSIVCDYLNEDVKDLLKPKGNRSGRGELIKIRKIVSLIAYDEYNYTYEKIGKYLLRDHVTIMVARKKAWNFYNQEKRFKKDVDNCRNLIERAIIEENVKEESE